MVSANNISEHQAMLESRTFQRAVDFTTLQYAMFLAQKVSDEPTYATTAGIKLAGMHEFMHSMKLLGIKPQVPVIVPTGNLDHKT